MKLSKTEKSLGVAAAKAGMDEKTGRKWRRVGQLPSAVREPRQYRTRLDPFAKVWREGNVVSSTDPKGNVSTVSFADDFGNGSNPGSGVGGTYGATYALPTLITSPPPTPGAPVHTARSQYDFSTGLLTGFKDRNNIVTQSIYNDPFNRPTLVKSALGVSGVESHAAMYYAPATHPSGITLTKNDVLTESDQTSLGDAVLPSWTVTEGFGRTKEAWSRDPQGDVKVMTNYDGLGRLSQTSNPFRPSQGESAVYTTTAYDLSGRVTSVTTPDNAVVNTSYSGNTVTVIDQAGKARRSVTEGLTGSSIKSLVNSVKDFARQEGLGKVELQAIGVINKDLEKRLLQQGFQRTTVLVDGEKVDALTKTIRVR